MNDLLWQVFWAALAESWRDLYADDELPDYSIWRRVGVRESLVALARKEDDRS